MSRKKIPRIAEFKTMPNALVSPANMIGNWNTHFGNEHPIILELGCGKGEHANALAREFPDRNFVGIDLKGARLWCGAKNALKDDLKNVRFLLINIGNILDYFGPHEVSEIFIPFPDPYPKPSKMKKRLVNEKYFNIYSQILVPGGMIHFKTDNTDLYNFALEIIQKGGHHIIVSTDDIYNSEHVDIYNSIPSYFEQVFKEQGEKIKYIRFSLNVL
jgi:tRNA (guanine-N7-)-methyltransferase